MSAAIESSGAWRAFVASALVAVSVAATAQTQQPREIRFERGSSEGRVEGSLKEEQVHAYRLSARKGQRLVAEIESSQGDAVFTVYPPGSRWLPESNDVDGDPLTSAGETRSLRTVLPANGAYLFVVGSARGPSRYVLRVSVTAADAAPASPTAAAAPPPASPPAPSAKAATPAFSPTATRFTLGFYSCTGAGSREQLLLMPSGRFVEVRYGSADEKAPKASMRAGRWKNERGAELDVASSWLPSPGWTRVKQKEDIEYRVMGASGDRFVVDLVDRFGGKVMVTEHRQCLRIGMGVDAESTALQQSVPESAFGGR